MTNNHFNIEADNQILTAAEDPIPYPTGNYCPSKLKTILYFYNLFFKFKYFYFSD